MKQVFQLIGIISIIAFLHGCDETKMSKDMIMEVMSDQDSTTENTDIQIPACKVGDVLSIGQVCMDEGTDAIFSVLDNGIASYTSSSGLLNEATDVLDATGQTLNDQSYNFIARKQDDGHWKIERVTSTVIEEEPEIEQDMSVIEPVVKEGNPPEPEPDPYQFSNNFTTADDGTITLREGNFLSIAGPTGGCIYLGGSINGVRYILHEFKWQTRQNAEADWIDIDSDKCDPDRVAIYGYDLNAADPGQYRAVLDMTTTRRMKLKTNTVIVE